jgi:hypothetical protein
MANQRSSTVVDATRDDFNRSLRGGGRARRLWNVVIVEFECELGGEQRHDRRDGRTGSPHVGQ